jgi:hypothetical protein
MKMRQLGQGLGEAMLTAVNIVRPGGAVGRVGVPQEKDIPAAIPTFYRNITIAGASNEGDRNAFSRRAPSRSVRVRDYRIELRRVGRRRQLLLQKRVVFTVTQTLLADANRTVASRPP